MVKSDLSYTPFGGESHVRYADVKFSGGLPEMCITVVFRSQEEVDELISQLALLRDNLSDPGGHFHLQDGHMSTGGRPAEIVFMNTAWMDQANEVEQRQMAHAEIRAFRNDRSRARE